MVIAQDGAVCEGAHVELRLAGSNSPARIVTSNADGRFDFPAVPAGFFKLSISSPGFTVESISGTLRAGEVYQAGLVTLSVNAVTEVRVSALSPQEIAQQQVNEEEKQRVLGIIPNFDIVYSPYAPPLTARQKFSLAWRSSIDPTTFLGTGATAALEQKSNAYAAYGQGAAGYARRFGAAYGDNVIGTMLGSALLASALKQDPRYFLKGSGSVRSRIFYAIANSVVCKGDNGRWQPAYSNFAAGFAAAGISNLYYPRTNRNGIGASFVNFSIAKVEGAGENIFEEFFSRRFTTHTRDSAMPAH